MFDSQSGGISLMIIVIFEAIAVGWFYGRYMTLKIHSLFIVFNIHHYIQFIIDNDAAKRKEKERTT